MGIKFGKRYLLEIHGIPNTSFKTDLDVYSTIDKPRGLEYGHRHTQA